MVNLLVSTLSVAYVGKLHRLNGLAVGSNLSVVYVGKLHRLNGLAGAF